MTDKNLYTVLLLGGTALFLGGVMMFAPAPQEPAQHIAAKPVAKPWWHVSDDVGSSLNACVTVTQMIDPYARNTVHHSFDLADSRTEMIIANKCRPEALAYMEECNKGKLRAQDCWDDGLFFIHEKLRSLQKEYLAGN